jgi:hypothetical protein
MVFRPRLAAPKTCNNLAGLLATLRGSVYLPSYSLSFFESSCEHVLCPRDLELCFCGWETWSVQLREEHWLKVIEDKVLRKIHACRREKVTRDLSKLCAVKSFVICARQILFGRSNQG